MIVYSTVVIDEEDVEITAMEEVRYLLYMHAYIGKCDYRWKELELKCGGYVI